MTSLGRSILILRATTRIAFAALAPSAAVLGFTVSVHAQTVQTIAVDGNQRVSENTVRAIAGIPVGGQVTPAQVNRALQSLYDSGFFEQVSISQLGSTITISVVENPTINRISIEGNRRIDDEVLLPLIGSAPRQTFSVSQTEADVRAIIEAYTAQGRIAAEVQPLIIRRADNRVDLVFEVLEGQVTEIDNVSFIGNGAFSDRRLRRVIETREARIFSGLFANDTFIEDRLSFDAQQLTEFYANRGYIDFQVLSSSAELSRERNAFLVNYTVQEGQQYRFGTAQFLSEVPDIETTEFEQVVRIREGSVFDPREIDLILQRLDDEADLQGLAFVRAEPRIIRDDDAKTVSVDFVLVRGPRAFVERIDIEGNSTTLDRVIRRQFDTVEGDVLNQRQIREANDRIRALGYFSSVEVTTREGSTPEQQIIDVDVEEQATGSINFGASFSSDSGVALSIGVTERNFLGRGQTVGAGFSTAPNNQNYNLRFVEPSVLDRDLRFIFNFNYNEASPSFVALLNDQIDIDVGLNFPVSENGRLTTSLFYRQDDVTLDDDEVTPDEATMADPATVTGFIANEERKTDTLGLQFIYVNDRRNSRVEPTAGSVFRVTQEFGGLAGSQQYSQTVVSYTTFRSFFSEQLVFSAEIEGGILEAFGDTDIPVLERFSLGGDQLRGFESSGIGPRDSQGDPLGGTKFAVARLEASFPLGLPEELGVFGGVFLDVGTVWDLDDDTVGGETVNDDPDLRAALGYSIFWETAIGPLRFNFSRALQKEDFDKTEDFRFTVDARF
ncbi:MAG: outer membrane protein assembly factor BamA [Pseudomonadota bacterium]